MPPVILTEPMRASEYLVSEANGYRSREVGLITGGAKYPPGTVLAKVTASGKLTLLAPTASDGSQTAVAILWAATDTTSSDVRQTITARDAEVNGNCLTWPTGITTAQQNAAIVALATQGIIVRT